MAQIESVEGKIDLDARGMRKGQKKASKSLERLEDSAQDATKSLDNLDEQTGSAKGFSSMASSAGGAAGKVLKVGGAVAAVGGAVAGKIGIDSVKAFGQFDKSITAAGAKADATEAQVQSMADAAIEAGQKSMFGAQEASRAMGFLAQAGLDVNQQMEALPAQLELATAGNLELARAADIATDTMSGFGLEVGELGRVNNVLVETANNANTSVNQLGAGLSKVAPLAASAGMSVEQTSAMLGKLATAGIKGSEGGQAVKQALAKLQAPVGKAKDELKRLGLTAADIQSTLDKKGLTGVVAQLDEQSRDTGRTLTQVLGRRAGPRLQALVNQGIDATKQFETQLNNVGDAAAENAARQMETLGGKIKVMKGSIDTAKIALGEQLEPVMASMAEKITELGNEFTHTARNSEQFQTTIDELSRSMPKLIESTSKLSASLAKIAPHAANLATNLTSVTQVVTEGVSVMFGMRDVSAKAEAGFQRLTGQMGFFEGMLNSVGASSHAFSGDLDALALESSRLADEQQAVIDAVNQFGLDTKQAQKAITDLNKEYRKMQNEQKGAAQTGAGLAAVLENQTTAAVERLIVQTTDGPEEAAAAMSQYNRVTSQMGDAASDAKKAFSDWLTTSQDQTDNVKNKMKQTTEQTRDLSKEIKGVADSLKQLPDDDILRAAMDPDVSLPELDQGPEGTVARALEQSGGRKVKDIPGTQSDTGSRVQEVKSFIQSKQSGSGKGGSEGDGSKKVDLMDDVETKPLNETVEDTTDNIGTGVDLAGDLASTFADVTGAAEGTKETIGGIEGALGDGTQLISSILTGNIAGIFKSGVGLVTGIADMIAGKKGKDKSQDESETSRRARERDRRLARWIGEETASSMEKHAGNTFIIAGNPNQQSTGNGAEDIDVQSVPRNSLRELGKELKREEQLNPEGI